MAIQAQHRDFRREPVRPKYGLPASSYLTPNTNDLLIIEDVPIRLQIEAALPYGTPHPKVAGYFLVYQSEPQSNGAEISVKRHYAAIRKAQNTYNYDISSVDDIGTYPIFVRKFVMPRILSLGLTLLSEGGQALEAETGSFLAAEAGIPYTPYCQLAQGQPLTEICWLVLVQGGSGYSSAPVISFSGAGGASASCQVIDGVIVAVQLQDGGLGYDSANPPTVTVTDGTGVGANIIAVVQPKNAVLVKETVTDVDDPELRSMFVLVVQIYKTLPGPAITSQSYNQRGETVTTVHQEVLASAAIDAEGLLVEEAKIEAQGFTAQRTFSSVVGRVTLTGRVYSKEIAQGGLASISETIIAPGSADDVLPDLSSTVLDAEIIPMEVTKSRKRVTTLAGAQPTTWEWLVDPRTNIPMLTSKVIVNASSVPLTAAGYSALKATMAANGLLDIRDALEFHAIDQWRSMQIVAKIPFIYSGNYTVQYPAIVHYEFPDVLTSAHFYFAYASSGQSPPFIAYDLGMNLQIRKGYTGPCKAVITETVTYSPNTVNFGNVTKWNRTQYMIASGWAIASSAQATARVTSFHIPPVVFAAPVVIGNAGLGIVPSGGAINPTGDITLIATDTTIPTPGSSYLIDVATERWKYGSYICKSTSITHP